MPVSLTTTSDEYLDSATDRFMRNVDPCGGTPAGAHYSSLNECWNWTGYRTAKGYGMMSFGSRPVRTHRVSWTLHYGKIPKGLQVLHHCDNPACVNPEHLFLGMNADNVRDRVRRDRGNRPIGDANPIRRNPAVCCRGDNHWSRTNPEKLLRGAVHGSAKLTESDVLAIRERYAGGAVFQHALAAEFGVSQHLISCITRRKIWTHI